MECLVYPFSEAFVPYVKFISELNAELHISRLVCPVTRTSDFSTAEQGEYDVTADFEAALEDVDVVIICRHKNVELLYDDVTEKIKLALKKQKLVFCCIQLCADTLAELSNMKEAKNGSFRYLANYPDFKNDMEDMFRDSYRVQDCVVIGIGGMLRDVDTDTTFCGLLTKLRSLGYSVAAIGKDFICQLLDCHVFPNNVFDSFEKESDKVLYINTFINRLQAEQCADIIFVQFPEGMMQYSKQVQEDSGIRSFIVSNALAVDYFILNIPCEAIKPDQLAELNMIFKYRFGFEIDAVGITNKSIDTHYTREAGAMFYNTETADKVDEYAEKCRSAYDSMTLFCVDDESAADIIADNIEQTLSSSIEVF